MLISEYTEALSEILKLSSFDDVSLNGVQLGAPDRELKRVAFAVDASLETIERAVESSCDVLVVHHGLFWGEPIAIKGMHRERVKRALDGALTLFAAHLPLDAHPLYGNNAQMLLKLGIKEYDPFGLYKGQYIGYTGTLPFPMSEEEIARLLDFDVERSVKLHSAKGRVNSVAVVSGGASSDSLEAIEKGIDLFITGEFLHQDYIAAKEAGLGVIAGGHYKSEVFGVKALKRLTEKKYGVDTSFIDAETGL